ncbi:MAG TPA: response regulator [Steroidobacteraceae bacterium]|nr:response regulator [Steroidobacteraceae bacterium]
MQTLKALLVEDDVDDAELLVRKIKEAGYILEWTRVETERDFLASLRTPPDIIFSDYSIPRFGGLRALEVLRSTGLDVPLILVSGTVGEEVAVEAMRYGATDYLLKDRTVRLATALKRALSDTLLRAEQRRTQEALRNSVQLLRSIVDHTMDCIMVVTPECVVSEINKPGLDMLEADSLAAAQTKPFVEFIMPAYRQGFQDVLRHVLAGKSELLEFEVLGLKGGRRWLETQAGPLLDAAARVEALICITRDVTERKRTDAQIRGQLEELQRWREVTLVAETAVRKSEELNRGVLDSMLAQIAVLDRNGKIMAVNDAWRRFAAERIGDKPEPLSRTHVGSSYLDIWRSSFEVLESEAMTVREGLQSLLRGERSSFTLEYSCRARDAKRWFLLSATPLKTEDGGAAVSHLDITERLAMEEQLRQSHRLDAVGQLTGGVAHDFNNMLTVILGNAELLQEALERDVVHRELAEMIVGAANSAAELTKRLLAFARKQALNPIAVDSNQLIAGMYPLLRRTLAANLEFEMVAEADVWQALVDPAQLENAVLNLCINARDAMLGGGRLRIETKNVELDKGYAAGQVDVKSGQYVLITVTDTGCGIAPDVLRRVFEPFFTTKDKGKGTGLGLAMVYGFIKQSDGHIRIFSELGHGTTVRMYLPRALGGSPHAAVAAGAFRIIHGTETILLVEDDEQVRRFALSQLKSLGYNVLQAHNGVEAMELIERNERIDLLFTDVVMPGMSGRQLADSARQRRPGLKVLFTSGYNEDAVVHHGRLDHGVQLLPKPYRRRELAKRIRSIFDAPC